MAYEFTKELETGNSMIDAQHKQLFRTLNDFLSACNSGKGRAEIEKTIGFLNDYVKKHFGDEEALQKKYAFPEYIRHKKLHDDFCRFVSDLAQQLSKEGPTVSLVGKVNSGVGGWLVNHIKIEDKRVAQHIKAAAK